MDKFSLSRNLGFFTGPLMVILGIMAYTSNKFPALAITIIILGIIRIGLTIYSYVLSKRNN